MNKMELALHPIPSKKQISLEDFEAVAPDSEFGFYPLID